MYINIPKYTSSTSTWSELIFETKEDYVSYIESQVKVPGSYNLKNTDEVWRQPGNVFRATGRYCNYVINTREYIKFWEFEKRKCLLTGGVEFDGIFVPGVMYFYINYLQINNKVKGKLDFPDIWDTDLHFFLHILLCKLTGQHSVVVKKRQAGYTFKHSAILLNSLWFGSAQINKIVSYGKSYVEGAWLFIEEYRNFLNTHTGWTRNFNPDKLLNWQQRIEVKDGRKKVYRGNMSVLRGITTEKSPSQGVGGKNDVVYIEEAGLNPTLGDTLEYLLPSVKAGKIVTGLVMVSGSVGELSDCQPLKNLMHNPQASGFRAVENIWEPDSPTRYVGFFVPEYWSYEGCIDEDGNSLIEESIKEIELARKAAKKRSPEKYRLYCSQAPMSLKEAFDWREESIFPANIIMDQMTRIQAGLDVTPLYVTIDWNEEGKLYHRILDRGTPVRDFPVKSDTRKEGCIVMYEPPDKEARFGSYFAGVDPVISGRSDTSESLFSIYIYKNLVETKRLVDKEIVTEVTGDYIVACWTGRFDDVNRTNERAEMLIEYYNALAIVENNVDSFIKHMIRKRKIKYLARKSDLPFISELRANRTSYEQFGVRTTETVKTYLLNTVIEYLKEEIGVKHDKDGNEAGKIFGVSKIPDDMLLLEMKEYTPDLNTDRIIAFALVLAFAKSRQANGLVIKKDDIKKIETAEPIKITKSPFKNIGSSNNQLNSGYTRSPFRNFM